MKEQTITKKGQRKYADPQGTLFNHPTRMKILENLQTGKKTTLELEKLTGENRVNLYHHLNLLENESLISSEKQNRQKYYNLKKNSNDKRNIDPENVILYFHISQSLEKKSVIIQLLNKLLDESFSKIPHIDKFDTKSFSTKRLILDFED